MRNKHLLSLQIFSIQIYVGRLKKNLGSESDALPSIILLCTYINNYKIYRFICMYIYIERDL